VNEEKSAHYHRLKRRALVVPAAWAVVLLSALLLTGVGVDLRERLQALFGGASPSHPSVLSAFVVAVMMLLEVGGLPAACYREFVLERRYGLSTERLGGWLVHRLKTLTLGVAFALAAANVVYPLLRLFPAWWWLPAGLLLTFFTVLLGTVGPVLILPLFYRVKPLAREALRIRLLALAERAGARVLGAYEWGLGDRTRTVNAALTGLGSARRILVSDTMLKDYSEDEIEVVLAHELAHHLHGDIWKGLLFERVTVVAGLYVASTCLAMWWSPLGLAGVHDPAGIPLVLLTAGAVTLASRPIAFAISRACERSADRFALALTRNPAAFVSAMRRLSAQNLAEEQPSRLTQWLFYSHPPARERIAAAQAFKA
jgi:STE24 endopeptidase